MFIKPIFYSILACFFWGLIFVIPLYLQHFCCIDIVLGRYLAFGIVSTVLLMYETITERNWQIFAYWKQASLCALVMNFSYYTVLTLGMRFSNPSLVALIIGMAPIVIVAVACKTAKNTKSYSILLGPACCIFFGITLINITAIQDQWRNLTVEQYLQGVLYGFLALSAWTWYVIYNAHLLHKNPQINPRQWTTLIGTVTLGFTLIGILLRWMMLQESYINQFSFDNGQGLNFIAGSLILGVVCSWLAFTLWNMASAQLPPELSGQLAILETVFGLTFIYLMRNQWPDFSEIVGITSILSGVWKGLYNFSKNQEFNYTNNR